ncbi:AraC family transcriptional regulator [Exilibacterium tricleocarpae]|uniref:AraC family transcriptional regulator n=1 Tax=Exilibacterium tricleocarpae TaxID=2591008 RepID=A0A545TFF9_9GAMM|nr:helix-turn-helix domain-containing protein [Exilibacterium tricleocarpae]TQV75962.1 AraC family transcriptional regulator [Exilibacterium tricleocarpae]
MLDFYKKATSICLILLVISAVIAFLCIGRTYLRVSLLAQKGQPLAWWVSAGADQDNGGGSTILVNDTAFSLDFDIHLRKGYEHPYARLSMVFGAESQGVKVVDLSRFQSLSFSAKCSPVSALSFSISTIDPEVTELDNPLTLRDSESYFPCSGQWRKASIDLTKLETQNWWLEKYDLDISARQYDLTRVSRISFGSTYQSPFGVDLKIQIEELTLHGRDWRYLYLLVVLMLGLWGSYVLWLFKAHSRALIGDLKFKLQKDRPLIAYQQLSVEPTRDRITGTLLSYIAKEYANPDLHLDTVVHALSISRTKINTILREELGFTFTAYLNKLRLTEAARLLAETGGANVAEIAYSVGYKNVSYFNKLFKEEYGCTPRTFKKVSLTQEEKPDKDKK